MGKRKDIERIETPAATETATAPVETKASSVEAAPAEIKPEVAADEVSTTVDAPEVEPTPAIAASPSNRFALLAASVALAAALGAAGGSLGTMSLMPIRTQPQTQAPAQARLPSVKAEDIAALKTSIEASNRLVTAQLAKMAERLERSERAQADPAKLAAIADTLSRVEHRITAAPAAAPEITGSVPEKQAAARTETKEPPKPVILEGWVLRDIYRGRALVEGNNRLFEIAPGSNLPGVGRVETITQQNGRWIVKTPKGLIVSMR
jgi:hypothetical protein